MKIITLPVKYFFSSLKLKDFYWLKKSFSYQKSSEKKNIFTGKKQIFMLLVKLFFFTDKNHFFFFEDKKFSLVEFFTGKKKPA